jgi:hypothetical protein
MISDLWETNFAPAAELGLDLLPELWRIFRGPYVTRKIVLRTRQLIAAQSGHEPIRVE